MIDSLPPVLSQDTKFLTECMVLIVNSDIASEEKVFIGES